MWETADGGGEATSVSAESVVAIVAAMDSDERSLVICTKNDGIAQLLVGGTIDAGFVVSYSNDQHCFFTVVNEAAEDGVTRWVVTGGQGSDFPARHVVDLATAQQAVEWWFGSTEHHLVWERD